MIPLWLYLLVINLLTFVLYWHDKRASRNGSWRVSEFMLLLVGFLGGTIAAFLAQRVLRHKNRKQSFQLKFWALSGVQLYLLIFPPSMLHLLTSRLFA